MGNNKVALITGAARGIGREIAKQLASEGFKVFAGDIAFDSVKNDKEQLDIVPLELDVSSLESWNKAVKEILDKEGRIDVLVNNAGINIRKTIEDMDEDELMKMLKVNVGGTFMGTKSVLTFMKENGGGCIINMSSVCGLIGHEFTPEAYTTTKGAITLLTKSIAARYGKYNIRCNSIHPSTVLTEFVSKAAKDPEWLENRYKEVPLNRLASVEDVANAVRFLVSGDATFINGVGLAVDGGVTCK